MGDKYTNGEKLFSLCHTAFVIQFPWDSIEIAAWMCLEEEFDSKFQNGALLEERVVGE